MLYLLWFSPGPPVQLLAPPTQLIISPTQPIHPGPMTEINWSHFKPEFAGKPDEDVEAHLIRTKDQMDTNAFEEGIRVQNFCLTLVGEARLWYESLRPIALDWKWLQNQFRQ